MVLDGLKSLPVRDIINCNAALGIPIIPVSNTSKALLARSIPHLHFDNSMINLHGLDFEVNSDRADIIISKRIVTESKKHRGLARVTFTN